MILLLLVGLVSGLPHAPGQTPLITAPAAHAHSGCPDAVSADGLLCRALEAQKNGDARAAAENFEQAAKTSKDQDPRTPRMWAAAGNLWIAAGQPAKAAADLDTALALPALQSEQRGEALLDRARAAEAQNDLATARAKLNEAVATIGKDPFYWYFSASLAMREGDPIAARSAIERALALAPDDPAILFEAGHVADYTGNDDEARRYWERASEGDPNGAIGKAAAKAIEMLGVTPTLKMDPGAPKPR